MLSFVLPGANSLFIASTHNVSSQGSIVREAACFVFSFLLLDLDLDRLAGFFFSLLDGVDRVDDDLDLDRLRALVPGDLPMTN